MNVPVRMYVDNSTNIEALELFRNTFSDFSIYLLEENKNHVPKIDEYDYKIIKKNSKLDKIIDANVDFTYLYMFENYEIFGTNYILCNSHSTIEDVTRLQEKEIRNHVAIGTTGVNDNLHYMIAGRRRYFDRRYGLTKIYKEQFNINPSAILFNYICYNENKFFNNIVDFYVELLETGVQNVENISGINEIINLYIASISIVHANIDEAYIIVGEEPWNVSPPKKKKSIIKRVIKKIIKRLKNL